MKSKRTWTKEEILADADYASRIRHEGTLFHGGLDAHGEYIPPRSRNRLAAIATWTAQLKSAGSATQVVVPEQVKRDFFPTVEQSKLLLRHEARGAMTRLLTLIGITEGFGNDGIKIMPRLDLPRYFREPIDGTCLAHLYEGLLEAHGNDEAGRGNEAGHDVMWYHIRDAALDHPTVTADMFENLPIAPPPGYAGPAKAAPEAISVSDLTNRLFPALDPMFELTLTALAQILVIEMLAFSTFAWAQEVLSDPSCSAAPEFAPRTVDYIQQDESIHVSYLQCALAEVSCRTLVTEDNTVLGGCNVVDSICAKILRSQMGTRWDRMVAYRMAQIREELASRSDGDQLLAEFGRCGPVPLAA
jgi:hypothetical protein